MVQRSDFDETFEALSGILRRQGKRLKIIVDRPGDLQLGFPDRVDRIGRPLFVAAVRKGKSYVSFHLMPIYACPELLDELTPAMKKRMQGKSCFNFKSVDAAQIKELEKLTRVGIGKFRKVTVPWE